MAHFDEKSGIVVAPTEWGQWYQTQSEVMIEVNLEPDTKGKEVQVILKPKQLKCTVRGQVIFEGVPFDVISESDSIWTIEDRKLLRIQLIKCQVKTDHCWTSLLKDQYQPRPDIVHEMRKKLDLEQFQIENPGMDFSGAKLSKNYDKKYLDKTERELGPVSQD
ncbi:hypothetical protein TCAL_02575 [Tigriopus californicus]|uniref:CS domain-containing protein n=2 Tax=Tigriopus californicus TaxID=6832 RepID=A0A553P7Z9_TIGCA|nr:hypothetical protein TCAL_02575 [Tigriopus californicus]|eukprot:TCALIF_02575-PA protein Name:"Similar to NUDCD2 NudC domain-containing protein 2 (Homo sapiens)" AED:0.37 eAED:0.37 QI:0/0.5/0.66/1/1/1/3/193/162